MKSVICSKCGRADRVQDECKHYYCVCGTVTSEVSPVLDTSTVGHVGNHYKFDFNGVRLDPYRILSVYGIRHPAQQHAIKKLLRAGQSVKSLEQDVDEVIATLQRWKEMMGEEKV